MKILLFLVAFCTYNSYIYSNDSVNPTQGTELTTIAPILFVIKVPINDDNRAELDEIKTLKAESVKIIETAQFLELHYIGEQLTSAVDPTFISEIKVYKNEELKNAYPLATTESVIEMKVDKASTLIEVFHAIKAM